MTLEKLSRAKMLQKHINELANFKDELSTVALVRVDNISLKFDVDDIEALKKVLDERIEKLVVEFEAL